MIDTSKLTDKDIGREVVLSIGNGITYFGKIIAWSSAGVYVRCCNHKIKCKTNFDNEFDYYDFSATTYSGWLEFVKPSKPIEIVLRWELMDLD